MPAFPAPSAAPVAHFCAAEFFRDCPWFHVPPDRKADILVEPLYPRLGLLGGAPETGGKVSKLAALAAARKKKEGGTPETPSTLEGPVTPSPRQGTPLSLKERLAANGKSLKPESNGLRRLAKTGPSAPSTPPEPRKPVTATVPEPSAAKEPDKKPPVNIRASPSTFASTIVGDAAGPTAQPSHLHSNSIDLLKVYGQDHAEIFDFAGPSPDDVVLNAQNTAKGLAIRRKVEATT